MANEKGFKFAIKGEVFMKQASDHGNDVVRAFNAADEARNALIKALSGIPAHFEVGEPMQATRRATDGEGKMHGQTPEPNAEAKK